MVKFGTKEDAKKQMAAMGLIAPYIGSEETRTEEEIKADRKTLAENVPILGEAMLAKEIASDVKDENYLSAGLNTLALGVGVVPGVGKVASKPIRAAAKAMRKDVKVKPTSVAGPYYDAPTYGDYHSRAAQVDQKKGLKKLKKLQGKNADFDLIQETVSESRIGNTRGQTAQADKVSFDPAELKNVKGLMGEELYRSGDYTPPGRGSKLKLLKKNIKEKGYKPEPITIVVREDGAPFIAEGNHRLAEALELRRPKIDANIQYLRNAEKVDGPLNPKRLKNSKSDIDLLVRTSYEIKNNKSKFKKGGVVPMNNMAKQMELFEPVERGFDEGGLMDEGGTIDPVSGNDVPPGSTQEEVRDDIPAQLSEGEFVFPADVVRYIGLESLMRMRQEAKQGLAQMEAMGQMGNSEEATVEDNLPFDMYDLDIEEDEEYNMASGGVIKAANGTFTLPNTTGGYKAPDPVTTSYTQPSQPTQTFQPYTPQFTTATQTEGAFQPKTLDPVTPTFSEFIGQNIPGVNFEYVNYVNESGQIIRLRKDKATGELLDPIPEGYTLESEQVKSATTTPTTTLGQTSVRDDGDGGNNDESPTTGASVSFGGTPARGDRAGLVDGAFKGNLSFTGVGLADTRGFLGSTFSSLTEAVSGGKMGTPLSLSGSQGAIISNILDPRTKVGVSPASALGFNLAFNAEQYNKYITRSGPVKITDRQQLAGIVKELSKIDDVLRGETISMERASYLANQIKAGREDDIRDSIEKSKSVDKAISDALGRDRGKVSGSGIFGTDIFGEDRTGAVSAAERAEMSTQEKAAVDAAMTAYAESMSTEETDDYEGAEADAAAANANNNDNNNNDGPSGTGGGDGSAGSDSGAVGDGKGDTDG